MSFHPSSLRELVCAVCIGATLALGASRDSEAQARPANRPIDGSSVAAGARTGANPDEASAASRLIAAARTQIGVTLTYDPAYVRLPYPNGDVPRDRGVCTDVVIRALRTQGLDLQRSVHEDMRANFAKYPNLWGLRAPDRNIDHRRVPNLRIWFARQGWSLRPSRDATAYRPGDLVTWTLPGNLPHIGIVSDRKSTAGTPLIIHNIGRGTREEDILFQYPITGHYRPRLQNP